MNLTWLEEPIPAENFDAFKTLTEETSTPISAGENVYLGHGFKQLLDNGVDIIMPDLQKCGGLRRRRNALQTLANFTMCLSLRIWWLPF